MKIIPNTKPPYSTIASSQSGSSSVSLGNVYNKTGSLNYFPSDLLGIGNQNPNFQFGLVLTFYQYSRPSVYIAGGLGTQLGTIILPLPNELVDTQQITYVEDKLSPVAAAALNIPEATQTGKAQTLWQNFLNVGQGILQQGLTGIVNDIGSLITGNKNTLKYSLQYAGLAVNPFMTMLFEAPAFKKYQFSWTLVPESAADSVTLDFIIKKLRYHSLPDYKLNNFLLTYPDIVVPLLVPGPYQFYFKKCVIDAVSVNYSPGDTPAFHTGTYAPVAVQLTISLLEIEMWTKEDIVNPPNSSFNGSVKNNVQGLNNTST